MQISENILKFITEIPSNVKLVAVSKTKPKEDILEAYNVGQRIFGENKIQDLAKKYEDLPKDIQWHFIGHLQSNKVKYIAPFVSLIHAVDSLKLLRKINSEAKKHNRTINCLLQLHIAKEDTKFGLDCDEVKEILRHPDFATLKNIRITGLMGMATYTIDNEQIKQEFKNLADCHIELKESFFKDSSYFKEISMGMSGDYKLAIEQGSTMIRVGSSIFGRRNY